MSHGSKSNNWLLCAMTQSPIIWMFEPWLKGQKKRCFRHGSKSNNMGIWAIANMGVWAKDEREFCCYFWCKFPHNLYDVVFGRSLDTGSVMLIRLFNFDVFSHFTFIHYTIWASTTQILQSSLLGLSICKNRKGLDLGHYFQIRFLWLL